MNYNERKMEVLSVLVSGIELRSFEIKNMISSINVNSLRTLLKRYNEQGLLKRKRVKKDNSNYKSFVYEISKKGLERLNWFIKIKQENGGLRYVSKQKQQHNKKKDN